MTRVNKYTALNFISFFKYISPIKNTPTGTKHVPIYTRYSKYIGFIPRGLESVICKIKEKTIINNKNSVNKNILLS